MTQHGGPFHGNGTIYESRGAAGAIGMVDAGVARVKMGMLWR